MKSLMLGAEDEEEHYFEEADPINIFLCVSSPSAFFFSFFIFFNGDGVKGGDTPVTGIDIFEQHPSILPFDYLLKMYYIVNKSRIS